MSWFWCVRPTTPPCVIRSSTESRASLVSASLGRLPYVEHVSMLGADFDVLVLVRAPDNAALRDLVLDRIQSIPGVRQPGATALRRTRLDARRGLRCPGSGACARQRRPA